MKLSIVSGRIALTIASSIDHLISGSTKFRENSERLVGTVLTKERRGEIHSAQVPLRSFEAQPLEPKPHPPSWLAPTRLSPTNKYTGFTKHCSQSKPHKQFDILSILLFYRLHKLISIPKPLSNPSTFSEITQVNLHQQKVFNIFFGQFCWTPPLESSLKTAS